jgi:hypothetical protein
LDLELGDIDFEVIFDAENSNNFPKNCFLGRENQLRMW